MLRNEKGFTLIELIMIIVILGILAAIAVPKYADLQDQAKDAVLDASVGALKSAAVIQYAAKSPNPTANPFASIRASTDLDPNVGVSTAQCSSGILTYGTRSKTFSIETTYCSG
jgi:MSHA pilin protein MshA